MGVHVLFISVEVFCFDCCQMSSYLTIPHLDKLKLELIYIHINNTLMKNQYDYFTYVVIFQIMISKHECEALCCCQYFSPSLVCSLKHE